MYSRILLALGLVIAVGCSDAPRMLGSTECGAVADCLDVGYPERGVCRP